MHKRIWYIKSYFLLDLVTIRLIEPASKRWTVELLSHYFGITYSQRVYQDIPKLLKQNSLVEQYAFRVAIEKFNETFYFLLYDVTTLYFETFQSDELRIPGFSKDNKSQQPRNVVWLLVTQSGFPLVYEVFPGNTFEGKTMLPVLDNFMNEHKDNRCNLCCNVFGRKIDRAPIKKHLLYCRS